MDAPSLEYLASLVEHKTEEPNVEYKAWMDLGENENKAKIAKHICGMANYGGGYIIFGVNDDGSLAEPHPGELHSYRQDIVNSIASKYLTPPPHCNVHFVAASNGKSYPVVVVPSHGAQPVCAKSDGPLTNGKRVGVQKGVHYLRVSGPNTVGIDSPEQWQEVLHRCVLKERDRLLSAISTLIERPLIEPPITTDPSLEEILSRWAELQLEGGWTVDLTKNRAAYAFQLLDDNKSIVSNVDLNVLREGTRRASLEAEQRIESEIPAFASINYHSRQRVTVSQDVEGYELQHVRENGSYLLPPALSQVFVNGSGGEVRAYWEDTSWVKKAVEERRSRKWEPGKHLTPKFQVDRAINFILFVKSLATNFTDARFVTFVADYGGLENRSIDDPTPGVYFSVNRVASVRARKTKTTVQLEGLTQTQIAEVAVNLIGPIFRLFDGWNVSAEYAQKRFNA